MDTLWGRNHLSSRTFCNFLQLSFDLVFVGLARHLLSASSMPTSLGGRGGGVKPPHFFEIIFLDICDTTAGGSFLQSLIHFYPIYHNPHLNYHIKHQTSLIIDYHLLYNNHLPPHFWKFLCFCSFCLYYF